MSQKRVVPFGKPPAPAPAPAGPILPLGRIFELQDERGEHGVEAPYMRTAAQEAEARAEYAAYCDTARLEATPTHPFAAGLPPNTNAQSAVEQERMLSLLGRASADAGISSLAEKEEQQDPTATLSASLRLSHEQLASLLASSLRDLASLQSQAREVDEASILAASSGAPRPLRAAAPFVLPPPPRTEPDPLRRRADDAQAAWRLL